MTDRDVLDISREAIMVMLAMAGPAMIVGLVVGVVISLVQALTQIQEMTLSAVPKIMAIFACLYLVMPRMSLLFHGFTLRLFDKIVGL